MKYSIALSLLIFILFIGCEEQSDTCIKGKLAFYERCFNVMVIEVIGGDLKGDSIKFFGFERANMVQFPMLFDDGILEVSVDSPFYFNYRFFDAKNDEYPVDDDICPANVIPFDIPTIIITDYSLSTCPE